MSRNLIHFLEIVLWYDRWWSTWDVKRSLKFVLVASVCVAASFLVFYFVGRYGTDNGDLWSTFKLDLFGDNSMPYKLFIIGFGALAGFIITVSALSVAAMVLIALFICCFVPGWLVYKTYKVFKYVVATWDRVFNKKNYCRNCVHFGSGNVDSIYATFSGRATCLLTLGFTNPNDTCPDFNETQEANND